VAPVGAGGDAHGAPPEVDGLLAELSERDVIVDDTVVFPGWDRSRRSVAGWWEFRSRGRRLLIKSIDATHYEARTGADLVYLRREPDALVLVQYKMLRQSGDGRWVYRIDRRLPGQLRRMIDCCQAATNGDHEPTSASTVDSFRIGPSSAFVKFMQPTRRLGADELTTGYYLPAEFVHSCSRARPKTIRGPQCCLSQKAATWIREHSYGSFKILG
jgi:hypothetical protein